MTKTSRERRHFPVPMRCPYRRHQIPIVPVAPDIVDLVAALFRAPPFSGPWSIF
jgi:hypothetical protein